MWSANWRREILTLPNLLSLLRILLIPVYVSVYLGATRHRDYLLAGVILSVSCLTDLADGIIARRFHMTTNLGKLLDPLADKLTQLALILSLSARYPGLYPVLGLFLVKETFQLGALVCFARKGKALSGALIPGKVCTTVLFVSLILPVLFPGLPEAAVNLLAATDTLFLLYAFLAYGAAYLGRGNRLEDLPGNG